MTMNKKNHLSSFRDKDAQVFVMNNEVYREIEYSYAKNYEILMGSGLYDELTKKQLLVEHEEISISDNGTRIIKPEPVFISYPYEWTFSQLKDAALLTLELQKIALRYNMSLKDANCYNVQFHKGKPIFIDTTSFEVYEKNTPWLAYNQFCKQFIAPLALIAHKDFRLSLLLNNFIDGIDLDLASKLLPKRTFFDLNLFLHIHQHSLFQKMYSQTRRKVKVKYSKFQLGALLDNLTNFIKSLKPKKQNTFWESYYEQTNYTNENFDIKTDILKTFKDQINPQIVVDFGANKGLFSRIFKDTSERIFSIDFDYNAVEQNYLTTKELNETNIYPLLIDLCAPSPGIGWKNEERSSFLERIKNSDLVMALALVHHLAIGNNLPFNKIAETFAFVGEHLIIEFVEKQDSQVKRLLNNRKDIFSDYTKQNFEHAFSAFYEIKNAQRIENSHRILYLMERRKIETQKCEV